jgi:hypothetical protein
MAWAIFARRFSWRRPKCKFSWTREAGSQPQQGVHDFIEAAVKAGAATKVDPPNREMAATLKAKEKR